MKAPWAYAGPGRREALCPLCGAPSTSRNLFAHGDPDPFPFIRIVPPDFGIQYGRFSTGFLVDHAVAEPVRRLSSAWSLRQEPEIFKVLQTAPGRLEAYAGDRLVVTHDLSPVDELARAVVRSFGQLVVLCLVPCGEGIPVEFPLDPAGLVFPADPADGAIHIEIQVGQRVGTDSRIPTLLVQHRTVKPGLDPFLPEVLDRLDVKRHRVANPKVDLGVHLLHGIL